MRAVVAAVLVQIGLLTAPDPAQMETAPDLGLHAGPHALQPARRRQDGRAVERRAQLAAAT